MKRRRSSPRGGGAEHAGLMPSGPASGPPVAGRVVVGVDDAVDMYDVFLMGPEPALRTPPHVDLGEAPRAAASFNHALQRTRPSRLQSARLGAAVAELGSFDATPSPRTLRA